jgi:predicted permease
VIEIVLALAPVFLLILFGHLFRRLRWVPDAFWPPAERMTYFLFFPSLLVLNTARADLSEIDLVPLAAALLAGIFLVSGGMAYLRRRLGATDAAFTSMFQGCIRPNTYVGIAAAVSMFDEVGLTLLAVCIVVCVPTVNLLSVIVLARHGAQGGRPGRRRTLLLVAQNPLILGCLIGAVMNAGEIPVPPVIDSLLEIFGRAALPVGLLAVGAGLDLGAVRPSGRLVAITMAAKLLVLPVVTFLACRIVGLDALATGISVMYATLPCSASSYVLARQLGGDAELMAGIITATTLGAIIGMPIGILLLQ